MSNDAATDSPLFEDFPAIRWPDELVKAAQAMTKPEEWHHYTNISGLFGILNKCQLWGTHIAFLNDSQELTFGIDALAHLVKLRANSEPPTFASNPDNTGIFNPTSALWQQLDSELIERKEEFKQKYGPFVACLSKSRDQLSQWRGYGSSGGYAIRFDPDALRKSISQVDEAGNPVPGAAVPTIEFVAYVWINFKAQIEWAAEEYLKEATRVHIDADTPDADVRALDAPRQKFYERVVYLASRMKSPSFAEENETRVICRCDETFYSQSPALGLVPRTRFGFSSNAIREVIVGPGEHSEIRKASIERFLARHPFDYQEVEVSISSIPYRSI